MTTQPTWWKEGIIYQIYPRSFQDSDGDGVGDLPGILQRLPHLRDLGVDIIWLSPVYQSPNDDNGYDISDYYQIMTEFGTMADFDRLLQAIHDHGMKLVMDLVVNHSSDEHTWFQESRQSQDNPYRDYYIWRPGRNGGPPNNWKSFFGGSAWEYDATTDEYYLHLFTRKQPDLNWENPALRQEIYRMMRYWLDKGVDGFRMDVIPLISKPQDFPDKDWETLGADFGAAYANGPRVHEYLQEMHREVLAHYDIVTVGEGVGITPDQANDYVGSDRKELHLIFHFGHMWIDFGPGGRMDPKPVALEEFVSVFDEWETALGDRGWGTIYLGNHDFARMVSRFGDDGAHRETSAKCLATLLMTRKGTPTVYQGDEIGMINADFAAVADYRDVEMMNAYQAWREAGKDDTTFLEVAARQGRDHARTPVQWSDEPQAGFTDGKPWINVAGHYHEINVAAQEQDPDSVLNYYRRIIRFRKDHPTLIYGATQPVAAGHHAIYAYERIGPDDRWLILLNLSGATLPLNHSLPAGEVAIGNYPVPASNASDLRPWEARVIRMA